MRLIGRLWRGEVPLGRTFWLFGVALGVALSQLAFRLNVIPPPRSALVGWAAAVVTAVAGVYILSVAVAIWRSADRYRGRPVWAVLAKITVALIVALMLAHTVIALLR
jgi:hypothetical protein